MTEKSPSSYDERPSQFVLDSEEFFFLEEELLRIARDHREMFQNPCKSIARHRGDIVPGMWVCFMCEELYKDAHRTHRIADRYTYLREKEYAARHKREQDLRRKLSRFDLIHR